MRRCGCRIECFTIDDSQVSVELLWCGSERSCRRTLWCCNGIGNCESKLPIPALHTFSRGQNKKFEDRPRTNARGRVWGRGQIFETKAEAKDKILASRTAWPRGLNITVLRGLNFALLLPLDYTAINTVYVRPYHEGYFVWIRRYRWFSVGGNGDCHRERCCRCHLFLGGI